MGWKRQNWAPHLAHRAVLMSKPVTFILALWASIYHVKVKNNSTIENCESINCVLADYAWESCICMVCMVQLWAPISNFFIYQLEQRSSSQIYPNLSPHTASVTRRRHASQLLNKIAFVSVLYNINMVQFYIQFCMYTTWYGKKATKRHSSSKLSRANNLVWQKRATAKSFLVQKKGQMHILIISSSFSFGW